MKGLVLNLEQPRTLRILIDTGPKKSSSEVHLNYGSQCSKIQRTYMSSYLSAELNELACSDVVALNY